MTHNRQFICIFKGETFYLYLWCVDGLFVSNYVGKTPFAAVNLIYPFIMILGAVGFMLGTGGSALVAKSLGEGKRERANQIFSFLIYVAIISGVVLAFVGVVFTRPIAILLGADSKGGVKTPSFIVTENSL